MGQIRVFIIDDQETVRRATIAYLHSFDDLSIVGEASDGIEAVNKVRTAYPDVILLDIAMPGPNGFETTRRLLAHDPAAKIIIVSGMATTQHMETSRRAGALDFVPKDKIPTDLVPAIRKVALIPRAGG